MQKKNKEIKKKPTITKTTAPLHLQLETQTINMK